MYGCRTHHCSSRLVGDKFKATTPFSIEGALSFSAFLPSHCFALFLLLGLASFPRFHHTSRKHRATHYFFVDFCFFTIIRHSSLRGIHSAFSPSRNPRPVSVSLRPHLTSSGPDSMIPYQALIPLFGIGAALYAGRSLSVMLTSHETLGKPRRALKDLWDEHLMHRNQVLTGHPYGQMNDLVAPEIFSRSDPVYLEKTLF